MSSTRPKRKAAVNKNYVDNVSESVFDQMISSSSSNSSSKSESNRSGMQVGGPKSPKKRPSGPISKAPVDVASVSVSVNGRRNTPVIDLTNAVPYNWQPPLLSGEEFSHKLNLTDATVNTALQTLICPHQGVAAPVQREELELKNLQSLLAKNISNTLEVVGPRRNKARCFQIKKGDYIYMVSEPPGEPYYIGRVKGFVRKNEGQKNDSTKVRKKERESESAVESAVHYEFQIQWFYRPRDISKHTLDSRLLFASMHSDTCPLSSFRGLLTVLHRSDVEAYFEPPKGSQLHWNSAVEFYSSFPNCFYFDKLFDRYILKFYDVVKTSTLLPYIDNTANCSKHYILALNKRFDFVAMEPTRTKGFLENFTSTMSTHCDVCAEWCGTSDSVTCAGCEKHYHMRCLDPPLMRKPSRGFSWSCAVCTKKHELEYQSRKILMLSHDNRSSNEQEISSVTDSTSSTLSSEVAVDSAVNSAADATAKKSYNHLPKYEKMAIEYLNKDASVSVLERRLKEEWNIRYMGLHARLEEAMDIFDRSYYPRVSTSLGQRYQATNIPECDGHPLVYYDVEKTLDKAKKKPSNGKKPARKKIELDDVKVLPIPKAYEEVSPKDFPKWLQPRPQGYIERGEDDGTGETCTLLWKPFESDIADNFQTLDAFIAAQNSVATKLDLHPNSPNFVDAVLKAYTSCNGNLIRAAEIVGRLTRASLKEPTFSKEEVRKFEAGVKKHGSELYPVAKEVKTQPLSMVVRFYYIWKKTLRGNQIWGTYPGRKKKTNKEAEMKIKPIIDDYADSEDDSSYENDKIVSKKQQFQCKHCKSYRSQKWFKITGFDGTTVHDDTSGSNDFDTNCVIGLCFRCAKIWRRYAVNWEDPIEVEKKNSKGPGGYRRKVESELVVDAEKILYHAREQGATITYDIPRNALESSVIGKTEGSGSRPSIINAGENQNISKGKTSITLRNTLKIPRVSESVILDEKKVTLKVQSDEEPRKKRKVEAQKPVEVVTPMKRVSASKPDTKSKKQKAVAEADAVYEVAAKKGPIKYPQMVKKVEYKMDMRNLRHTKHPDLTTLASPLFNTNYSSMLEDIISALKSEKKTLLPITKETLGGILDEFKFRQLLDVKSLAQGWQFPQHARIDLPFAPEDRKCSICWEVDDYESSFQESLICSNCGVNVHSSCAGITVTGKTKPIKQWLCDPCVNDMQLKFDPNYSCSICIKVSTNPELALTGDPSERPDFLVPVLETGKWCHLICALFCHRHVSLRHVLPPNVVSKEIITSTSTKNSGLCVESVSKVFVENFDKRCDICQCLGGGLVKCDACANYFHVTCAQDTPEFKVGFKLEVVRAASNSKSHTTTIIRDQVGKLEPALLCSKHSHIDSVLSMRELGKRTATSDPRPLIQLSIEDLVRKGVRTSGPQLRADNYLWMIETFMKKLEIDTTKSSARKSPGTSCHFCKVDSSPKWWPLKSEPRSYTHTNLIDESENDLQIEEVDANGQPFPKFACQKCHFRGTKEVIGDANRAGDNLMKELTEPINALKLGINSESDRLNYDVQEHRPHVLDRSKITWKDILE